MRYNTIKNNGSILVQTLQEIVTKKTTQNTQEILSTLASMICTQEECITLSEEVLVNALALHGEFFILQLHYNDWEKELKEAKIKYKISQSLNIVVRYEDDGNSLQDIKKFAAYMHNIVDDKQSLTFGVKKVAKLSEFPITILFTGILPINQLTMKLGEKVYDLINSDVEYFKPRFKQLRDDISQEIGVTILPLFPKIDENLNPYQVELFDPIEKKTIASFHIPQTDKKETLEIYLLKLFYIYKQIMKKT
jgi:hypothetical protein